MGDQPRSDRLSEEGGKVGSDEVHLLDEVGLESLPVVGEVNDSVGEVGDVDEIDRSDVGSHGSSSSIEDVLSPDLVVVQNLLHVLEVRLGKPALVSDELGHPGVLVVVGNESDELGEVPSVPGMSKIGLSASEVAKERTKTSSNSPLSHSHGEGVDVLVELIRESDSLDDHVVGSVDVELEEERRRR